MSLDCYAAGPGFLGPLNVCTSKVTTFNGVETTYCPLDNQTIYERPLPLAIPCLL